jgi:hypothetical protein
MLQATQSRRQEQCEGQFIQVVTEQNLLSKWLASLFLPNNFNAYSGDTCHMCCSLERMLYLKPHVNQIMVVKNETMSNVSKGNFKGLMCQKDGSSMDLTLQDVLYIPNLMVNFFFRVKLSLQNGLIFNIQGK